MIHYSKRRDRIWKYDLMEDDISETGIVLIEAYYSDYLCIDINGQLWIGEGYSWDGASFIMKDTDTVMSASLHHDGGYQLIRLGVLRPEDRKRIDEIFRDDCIKAGMSKIRAWAAYRFVRAFGRNSSKTDVRTAP